MPGEQAVKSEEVNFKEKYRSLKRKMRFLIYEQECFQEELRRAQRKLLKISRDKNFLLDRLLQYERVIDPGTDSDSTLSSEDSCKETKKEPEKKVVKKKRRPKKKPVKRLQGTPLLGNNRNPLPHDLHSPPQSLHQQLPHLAELMRKAAEGLPITQSMSLPGLTSTHDQQQAPGLPSPHPLLSPHHAALLSPTGALALPPPALPPGIDPRAFDRGLHQQYALPTLLGMGAGPMGLAGVPPLPPQMDFSALTAAAALDKVGQERSKKKSKKDSDKHAIASRSQSSHHGTALLSQASTALARLDSAHEEHNEDLVIDLPDTKP